MYRLKSNRRSVVEGREEAPPLDYDSLGVDSYNIHVKIPICEFLDGLDIPGIFDYLMRESCGPVWFKNGKQPIRFGDVLTYELHTYMVKPPSMCRPVLLSLEAWPDLGIDPITME